MGKVNIVLQVLRLYRLFCLIIETAMIFGIMGVSPAVFLLCIYPSFTFMYKEGFFLECEMNFFTFAKIPVKVMGYSNE